MPQHRATMLLKNFCPCAMFSSPPWAIRQMSQNPKKKLDRRNKFMNFLCVVLFSTSSRLQVNMGNKAATQRRPSNGAALSSNGQIPSTPTPQPQALLVQQHHQRMNRRSSEYRTSPAEFAAERAITQQNELSVDNRMRRRWSSAASISQRNTMKPKRLAPRQRNLIIKSWNRMAKTRVGKDIFMAIFNEAEELKQVFGIPVSSRGKKLRSDPKFVSHTDLFIDTFDFVISNLDDISMVTENAENLGRRHAMLQIENFRPEYWNIFTECIVENVSNGMDNETKIAWRQLVLMLIFYIRLGFDRENLRLSRHQSVRRCNTTSGGTIQDIPLLLYPS
ncbi:GLOBIN domain-containing protein [Aphelenchoides bicaudatus]|nr:GLOBIN domain-containing protein [Aphelenchoides bicaudatus]